MTWLVDWMRDLILVSLCLAAAEFLAPAGATRPAVRLVLGLVLMAAVVEPLVTLVGTGAGAVRQEDTPLTGVARRQDAAETVTADPRFRRVVEVGIEAQAARLFEAVASPALAGGDRAGQAATPARPTLAVQAVARTWWDRSGALERIDLRIRVAGPVVAGPVGHAQAKTEGADDAGTPIATIARTVSEGVAALYGLSFNQVRTVVEVVAPSPGDARAAGGASG